MGNGRSIARRSGKKCKRCCINLKRCLKRTFTCSGKMPRCCRRMRRKCKKLFCFSPCCTWCNLCESCRRCRRWARRCVCRPRVMRRVAHVEYYKVKKRRRTAKPEQATEDHNQVVLYCTVSTHFKPNTATEEKSTDKVSDKSESNHEETNPVQNEEVNEETSKSV